MDLARKRLTDAQDAGNREITQSDVLEAVRRQARRVWAKAIVTGFVLTAIVAAIPR